MYIMCTYWWMCPWLCPPVFWLQSHTAGRQCRLLHSLLCDQKGGQWIPDNEYQAIMPSAADFIPIRWSFIFSNTGSISSRVKLLEPTRPFSIPNKPPPFLELKTKEKKCTNYSLDNIKNVIPDTLKLIFHTYLGLLVSLMTTSSSSSSISSSSLDSYSTDSKSPFMEAGCISWKTNEELSMWHLVTYFNHINLTADVLGI